jgi:hypothetical protein
MTEHHSDLRAEMNAGNAAEPLLPIEKKLIAYSLGLGIALLVILSVINRFV